MELIAVISTEIDILAERYRTFGKSINSCFVVVGRKLRLLMCVMWIIHFSAAPLGVFSCFTADAATDTNELMAKCDELVHAKNYEEALAILETVSPEHASEIAVIRRKASILNLLGNFSDSNELIMRALNNKNLSKKDQYRLNKVSADNYMKLDEPDKAYKHCKKALSAEPEDPFLWYIMAKSLNGKQKYRDSNDFAKRFLRESRDRPKYMRINAYRISMENLFHLGKDETRNLEAIARDFHEEYPEEGARIERDLISYLYDDNPLEYVNELEELTGKYPNDLGILALITSYYLNIIDAPGSRDKLNVLVPKLKSALADCDRQAEGRAVIDLSETVLSDIQKIEEKGVES